MGNGLPKNEATRSRTVFLRCVDSSRKHQRYFNAPIAPVPPVLKISVLTTFVFMGGVNDGHVAELASCVVVSTDST